MAELDADFDKPLNMRSFPVGRLADAEASFADSTGVVLTADPLELDILGEGLEYDDTGALVGGTITDVDVYFEDELWFTLADAALSVETLQDAASDADPLAFFEAFLDGDDEIRGSSGADQLLGFAGDDRILGGEGNDILEGGDGDDELDGGAGVDQMRGGAGDDRYRVDNPRDRVLEVANEGYDTVASEIDLVLPEHVEALVLLGGGDLSGTGNALSNRLVGNAGDNRLDGRGGADEMEGGAGRDTYLVDDAADRILEEESGGIDTVIATTDFTLPDHVERLVLAPGSAVSGTGNDLENEIIGNERANVLDGRGGNDRLVGGRGNDIYWIDGSGDVVVEERGGGIDTIRIEGDVGLESRDHVENVELLGSGDFRAVGNALANRLVGNAGDNVLSGLAGNDVLQGGAGDDTLLGGIGNDLLEGGAGEDVLRGGAGRDRLTGGTGADAFVVGDAARSIATITDFSRAEGDRIAVGALLDGLDDDADLTPYLRLVEKGRAVNLFVDPDGPGRARPLQVAVVLGNLGTDLAALLADGTIDLA